MPSFKLDDIRAAADKKYGPTIIEVGDESVTLLNPLRLSEAKRDALVKLQDSMASSDSDEDEDDNASQAEQLRGALRLVAKDETEAEVLIDAIGDDLALLVEVFGHYGEEQEVGEASPSAA